ncbi:pseudaminic acid biosynthesis N-acetyl transferase [Sulfuricurvum kujiense DSM 16994]|uniref:Pseudaminic acid biosynthesis N-acetyl transferase n=1 Tax=Sulfuricurvum kujiense (strain ATCC BAA-921 / DSM 16994 / JCM 11577 / YK-1) TaxID=709032 RepID=E4TXC4_SULKY|nr:UDP-4-amino-4,6-dideoxy-N-acetyl-beta-L-altrosamine N-acetyltransferase [Sulfuricurvum kujiense]ADR32821.1 pseudaminic acid biosynthesis N-acetyl transferase [Sulfuricurvum kujiense DSM 16994]
MQVRLLDFTTLETQLLTMVLAWRNHSDISRWMVNTEEISIENHLRFVESLKNRADKRYFLVQDEDRYIGVIDFTDIAQNSAEIGIYANPELRGVGEDLMRTVIEYGFTSLSVRTLIASVFADNERAKHLYEKFDFIETNRTHYNGREMITMELKK